MIDPLVVVVLSLLCCIDLSALVSESAAIDAQSFSQRIATLQTDTRYACTQLKDTTLAATKQMKVLMNDVHEHCPDLKSMEVELMNVGVMAEKYDSFVAQQLTTCQELSKMLNKGLENGGLVVFYLKEGNYSLVTDLLDKWHQEFTKLQATFYLTDTPLEIMLKSKKVFYYNHWFENIIRSISKIVLVTAASVVLASITVWITSILDYVALLSRFLTRLRRRKTPRRPQPAEKTTFENASTDSDLRQRRTTTEPSPLSAGNAAPPLAPASSKLYFVRALIFSIVVIALIAMCCPNLVSLSGSASRLWYPEATATLDKLRLSRDSLQSNLSQQIQSIEELQRHASMYHDATLQAHVDEFVRALGQSVQQVSKELSNAYISSEKMPSTLRRAHKSIESRAEKLGKLHDVKNLLFDLEKAAEKHEQFQRALQTAVLQQQKVLPILKEQTQAMRVLVQDDRLVEISRLINHHQDALLEIDGTLYRVDIELTNFIQVINDEHIDGMKKTIELLKDNYATDQLKAMLSGALGVVGASGGAVAGTLALKTGFAMVSITAAPVAGVAATVVGGLSMFGLGAVWAVNKFDKYKELAHFRDELSEVETQRMNIQVAMEKVQAAVTAQQTSLKSTQSSLGKIANHCNRFSGIPGFTLNRDQRNAINDELLNAAIEYNRMIAVYSLFTQKTDHKDHALPPAQPKEL